MPLIDLLLPEFDREMGLVRKVVERVPDAQLSFRPHTKSMSAGELATHLSNIPLWAAETMRTRELDLPSDARATVPDTVAAIVAHFDAQVADARRRLVDASDAELMIPWTFKVDGAALFTMPRVTVLRTFVLNHAVHHRGQLTVYLRLLDVPVPSLYGPSADEK